MRVMAPEREAARGGEKPEEALLRLREAILALGRARLGSPEDAQDAYQETCLRVLRGAAAWRPEAPFEHWVFTIAANVVRDMLRRRQTRREAPLPAAEPVALAPEGALEDGDELERIRRAIEALDPSESGPLLLHLLHGMPQREIAAHLDLPVEHLRVRLFRAIRKIRRAVKE
jgi:RNA polymerase sigma-70 factor (ECF subfamily)